MQPNYHCPIRYLVVNYIYTIHQTARHRGIQSDRNRNTNTCLHTHTNTQTHKHTYTKKPTYTNTQKHTVSIYNPWVNFCIGSLQPAARIASTIQTNYILWAVLSEPASTLRISDSVEEGKRYELFSRH